MKFPILMPLEFAPQDRIKLHTALKEDFIRRVLGTEGAFLSDESSLWDFHGDLDNAELQEKILETYGVDVSDIESGNIAEILERIARRPKART